MTKADVQIFASDGSGTSTWQVWNKPRGITMCHMVAISGGGGGSSGFCATSASLGAGGGAGGACSGISRLTTPALLLPDILYVQVGNRGIGGVASISGTSNAGSAGTNTYIAFGHSASGAPNVILSSGVNAPGGGAAATATAGGVGGAVPTIATTATPNCMGDWFATVGLVGAAGGTPGSAGTAVTAWGALPLSPGAGGAGTTQSLSYAGGAQTATVQADFGTQVFSVSAGGLSLGGVAGIGGNGNSGIAMWQPFFMTGGSGGGSAATGAFSGGAGGKGDIGCGGGGGGAGASGSGITGGRGGDGGPGCAMIFSW